MGADRNVVGGCYAATTPVNIDQKQQLAVQLAHSKTRDNRDQERRMAWHKVAHGANRGKENKEEILPCCRRAVEVRSAAEAFGDGYSHHRYNHTTKNRGKRRHAANLVEN